LMELHQVDAIRLQPLQRFVDLPGGGLPGPAVDLRHEEDSLAIAVTQRPPHADFAGAAIIIPAVVHEGEPPIDRAADNRYTLRFVSLFADVIPTQADGRDFLSSPPNERWGIPSLVSAIKVCGLAAPKTAAAAADFRNERLLTVASVCLHGSNWLVSSTIVLIYVLPWLARWVRLIAVSIVDGFYIVVPREVVIDSRKIF